MIIPMAWETPRHAIFVTVTPTPKPPRSPLALLVLSADQVAQDFTNAFYDALIVAGETVQRAFDIAREHMSAVNYAAASFVLLPQGESPQTPADNAATGVGAGDGCPQDHRLEALWRFEETRENQKLLKNIAIVGVEQMAAGTE